VVGLTEPDELKEEVDPALFGTLLHESIRKIYRSLNNPIQKADLKLIVKDDKKIRKAINEAFGEVWYREGDSAGEPEGRNLVIREIIFTYLQKILERDQEYCPIQIYSLELPYYTGLAFKSSGRDHRVKIGGKIDRIDESGGFYRVLDYKTGKGEMSFESIEDLFDGEQKNRNWAAFQTFLYAKVFKSQDGMDEAKIMPGIYLIRDIYNRDFNYRFRMGPAKKQIPVPDYSTFDEEFTSHLQTLLADLFDPEVPFQQTSEEETCRNCPYKGICNR
jgi:ATP-dependent helicase/DNAse subunit B